MASQYCDTKSSMVEDLFKTPCNSQFSLPPCPIMAPCRLQEYIKPPCPVETNVVKICKVKTQKCKTETQPNSYRIT